MSLIVNYLTAKIYDVLQEKKSIIEADNRY